MKKLISIILCICLMVIPINVTALDLPDTNTTEITDETIVNGESIETEIIDDSTVTISPNDNSPEAQAIRKILEHKEANGETVETRAQTPGLIDGGIYYIKNYFSGKYLNVHYGVDANGTNVYQWTKDSSTEQKFKVVYDSATDSYKIYAMCSSNGNNRVLDVVRNGSPLATGQNVDIWTPVDHTAQRLRLTYLIDGLYHIHMLGNKDLYFTTHDSLNGTSGGTSSTSAGNVYIRTFDVDLNQQWYFELISTAATPTGRLENVNVNEISGWAWRSDLPTTGISVHISLNNTTTGESWTARTTANKYRSDLVNSGIGDGYHGFSYAIDWAEYPAGSYIVRAYAVGENNTLTQLSNSPQSYQSALIYDYSKSVEQALAWTTFEETAIVPVSCRVKFNCNLTVEEYTSRTVTYVSCFASYEKNANPEILQPDISIGNTYIDSQLLTMQVNNNSFILPVNTRYAAEHSSPMMTVGNNATFSSIATLMLSSSLFGYRSVENEFTF